ncbi:tyrosine-type recombinase/integrase [Hirschia litorea]|uniref:Tyrosine-type recombinase/integrase n=1 Tax=Hirschia litorea TaxID=1199156 RepID=A0ABW2INV8_9PROT
MAKTVNIGKIAIRPHRRNGTLSGSWQVDIPPPLSQEGKRERRLFKTKADAINYAKKHDRSASIKNVIRSSQVGVALGLSFSELSELWMEEQIREVNVGMKRASSLDTNAYQLRALLSFFNTSDINTISSIQILSYQEKRRDLAKSAPTINSETALLKQILLWAKDKDLCTHIPKFKSIPVKRKHMELPTLGEIRAIAAQMSEENSLVFRFFAETGCRKSEVFGLEWQDIGFNSCVVHIRPHVETGHEAKNESSYRSIPISTNLVQELNKIKRTTGLVFPGRDGKKRHDMKKAIKRAVTRADIRRNGEIMHITLHMLRKAHSTWQAMKGLPEPILQARLGHVPGSRVTQEVYIHARQESERTGVFEV